MKRGMLILLFIFVLASSVSAMTVELVSPDDGNIFTDVDSVSLTCKATISADEELSNLTLYFENNETVAWHAAETVEPPDVESGANKIFSVSGLVNATYTWNCLAASNNSVETWGSNRTFIITFTTAPPPAPNTAPTCTVADTNITVDEDSGAWTLDENMSIAVNISCSDTDGNALTYTITSGASGSYGTFSNPNNDNLVYTTKANQSGGIDVVTLSVSDGTDSIYVSAQVNVTAVNDAPYLSSIISNQTWDQDKNKTIDLDNYFSDIDDSSLNYTYTFTSTGTININVTIESDGDAVFTPDSDWTGTETLTFTATDSGGLSVTSNEVILTVEEANVTEENNPPNIDSYTPEADPTISVGESQVFSITKSDPDGDDMNVTWYVDHVIQEGKTGDSFTYTSSSIGSFVIKVSVSDGLASDSNTWTLIVQAAGAVINRTAAPGEEKLEEKVSACGDGNCSEDETQLGCCKDCGCPEGYTCEDDKCRKEKKAGNIILLIVVLGLFAGGAGAGLYFYKKKQEKEIFGLAKTPFEAPPKEAPKEKIEVKEVKPVTKPEKKPLKKVKTTSQVLLKQYMIYNLRKGKSFEQVKKELLKVGWKEDQIQDAYTAAQLDEAFS